MADIEDVIKALENALMEKIFDGEFVLLSAYIIADAIELLKEQPQIVRCKDCKHGTTCFGHFISCEIFEVARKPDFYCADVEKRSD